jgi:hypothetical protein
MRQVYSSFSDGMRDADAPERTSRAMADLSSNSMSAQALMGGRAPERRESRERLYDSRSEMKSTAKPRHSHKWQLT